MQGARRLLHVDRGDNQFANENDAVPVMPYSRGIGSARVGQRSEKPLPASRGVEGANA
jgi:hypothetical protein